MHGTVRVYKEFDSKPIIEESNLILDGFKEHIADMMTWVPAPSGVFSSVSAGYNVSNFTIQAVTFGPCEAALQRADALITASGYTLTSAPSSFGVSSFNRTGESWTYMKDIPNNFFSSVHSNSASSFPNSLLENPTFSSYTPYLKNGKFKSYSLDYDLSGSFINELLELYELPGWSIQSYLRYDPSSTEYDDTYVAGSCARYAISSVSDLYSFLSATYADADEGVLYIRSFATSSEGDTSGAVKLTQPFLFKTDGFSPLSHTASATSIAEITAQFSSVSGTGSEAAIHVSLRDITRGDSYNFDTGAYTRHSWQGSGTPLIIPASAATSGTISKFFNIPNNRLQDKFEVEFSFFCASSNNPLGVYFWNANVQQCDGWKFGNIYEDSDICRVINDDYQTPGMFFYASSIGADVSATPLSSTTYVSQGVRLDPVKKYSFNPMPYGSWGSSADSINYGLVKWTGSNVREEFRYNLLSDITSKTIVETRLNDANYVVTPNLSRTSTYNDTNIYREQILKDDLFLEVTGERLGVFSVEDGQSIDLQFSFLKDYENGASAGVSKISLQTVKYATDGERKFYDFLENKWDTSSENSNLYTSSLDATGLVGHYDGGLISLEGLDGLVDLNDERAYDLILSVENVGDNPSYVKAIRCNSTAPAEVPMVYGFKTSTSYIGYPELSWSGVERNRNYLFSGLGNLYTPEVPINYGSQAGAVLIEGMYADPYTIHSNESEYEVFLINSNLNSIFNYVQLRAPLTDASLSLCTEEISDEILTSEDYINTPRFNIVGQPFFEYNALSGLYPDTSSGWFFRAPGGAVNYIASASYEYFSGTGGLNIHYPFDASNTAGGFEISPKTKLGYTYALSDINLPLSATEMAFGFEYNCLETSSYPTVSWQAAATTKDGHVVWWDSTIDKWEHYDISSQPLNAFDHTLQPGDLSAVTKTAFSTKVDITSERFDATTKITFYVVCTEWAANSASQPVDTFFMTNWRFYTINELPPDHLPEFPSPLDRTVQTLNTETAPYGHFGNELQFWDNISGTSYERLEGRINFPPNQKESLLGGDISYPGGTSRCYGNLYGVINSEGYLLSGLNGLLSNLAVRGFVTSATTSSIVLTVDLAQDYGVNNYEIDALDEQGGIAAIGLWVLDTKATYKKHLDNGYDLSAIYDTPGSGSAIYNLTDTDRNPVFKLVAKKVFRQAITPSSGRTTGDFIRIQWEINFL